MRKPRTKDREEVEDEDCGDNAAKAKTIASQQRSPLVHFFISVWTRVKFLFTTALAEACECSAPAKSRSFNRNSPSPFKELDLESNSRETFPNTVPLEEAVNSAFVVEQHATPTPSSPPGDHSTQPVAKVARLPILRETSTLLEHFYEDLDELGNADMDPLAGVHLEPVVPSLSSDHVISGATVAFVQPILLTSAAPLTHSAKLLTVVEQFPFTELPERVEKEELEELKFECIPESLCCSTEFSSEVDCPPVPVTTLGRLHTQFKNGEMSKEEYNDLVSHVIDSTLPRNLSDTPETRKPIGANQLYAWQVQPNLPDENVEIDFPNHPENAVTSDATPISFINDLISNAIEEVSREEGFKTEKNEIVIEKEGATVKDSTLTITLQEQPQSSRQSFREHQFPPTEVPLNHDCLCASDISYDGIYSSSFDRVRSVRTYYNECNMRSKRSSSLKSGRSPSRKIVRFADSLGLDLATIRQVKDQDHPPQIPASATLDLNLDSEKSLCSLGAKQFQICFPQPGASSSFMHRVLTSYVCLENARVDSSRGLLTGTVRVKSVGFEKKVFIRLTYNNWSTFTEVPAAYVQDSHDGATDRFSFSAVFPTSIVAQDKAQFAVRYETHTGEVHWDNNHAENYQILCYAKATDMAGDGSWIHYI